MNTTAAAATAGVTVDTIRAWCRYGAVEAVKQAGRWVIDTASLAARITIATRRTSRTVHYRCHTIRTYGPGPTRIDGPCPTCHQAQRDRSAQAAPRGPLATRAQVNYLASLIGPGAIREELENLPRSEASAQIDQLKNTRRPARNRCACPSGRYGGVCTC